MSTPRQSEFLLLWKGRQDGPFTLPAIREKLAAGEISRMHQVNFNDTWMVLDEFLEKHGGGDPEAQRRADAVRQEMRLAIERTKQSGLEENVAEPEERSPLSHLLPRQMPPPIPILSPLPPEDDAAESPQAERKGFPVVTWVLIAVGCVGLFIFLMVAVGTGLPVLAHSRKNASERPQSPPRIEKGIAARVQTEATANRQKIFDNIHPAGAGKRVTVHEVTVTAWKNGQDTNRMEDIQQFKVLYTLFWEAPLMSNGYTKLSQTYDTDPQYDAPTYILSTNGVTITDAGKALGPLLRSWFP